jgi:hypothetical protein
MRKEIEHNPLDSWSALLLPGPGALHDERGLLYVHLFVYAPSAIPFLDGKD